MATPNEKIVIRPYKSCSDSELLLEHLKKYFLHDSPIFSGLNMNEHESEPFFQQIIRDADAADVSYVALDMDQSSVIGRWPIIGCVLASIMDNDDPNLKSPAPQLTTKKQKTLVQFVNDMYESAFQDLSESRLLKLDIFSVHPSYRHQRLCRRMLRMCMQDAVERKHCDAALVLATSHLSQSLLVDEKFVTVNLCYFQDRNKKHSDPECRFVMKDKKNTTAKVMMKIMVESALCQ